MEHQRLFEILCFLFSIGFYVPYIADVLSGKATPAFSMWLTWLVMDIAILAAMLVQGSFSWQLTAFTVGTVALIAVSLWKKTKVEWTTLDWFCFGSAIVAVILWFVSRDPDVAIVLSLVAMNIGSLPTYVRLWKDPMYQPLFPWLLCLTGGFFGLLVIQEWSIAGALTPVTFFFFQVLIVMFICRRFLPKKETRS